MTMKFSKVEVTGGIDKDNFSGQVESESLTKEVERSGKE